MNAKHEWLRYRYPAKHAFGRTDLVRYLHVFIEETDAKNGKIMYDPTYRDTLGFNTLRNKRYNFLFNSETKRKNKNDNYKSLSNETNQLMAGFKKKNPGYAIYKKKNTVNRNIGNKIILPVINRNKKKLPKSGFKTEKEKIILEKSEESGSVGENSNEEKSEKENEGSKDE